MRTIQRGKGGAEGEATEGYALPFKCQPQAYFKANHRSARKEADFVEQAINDQLKSSCMKEVDLSELSVVSPLIVFNQGKKTDVRFQVFKQAFAEV